MRKRSGKPYVYRGRIDTLTIQQRENEFLHVGLIMDITDVKDEPLADHCWVSFPFDLYTRFRKGERIEFTAVSNHYSRMDGTHDYGLAANGDIKRVPI